MSFVPVIPTGGYAGWKFLQRTLENQQTTHAATGTIKRDETHFREQIGQIRTAEDLVADRTLLRVALGAFGLDDDIDNRFFVRKVLEEGTLDDGSLANRLSDTRYRDFSKAFGFGDYSTPRTILSDFADEILTRYASMQFEASVGTVDGDMRLALATQRELPVLASSSATERTKWYTIIGSSSLSLAFQKALGLPSSIGSIDVDQQVTAYQRKAKSLFGSSDPSVFADPARTEEFVRTMLLRAEITSVQSTSTSAVALQLLQDVGSTGLSLRL